MATRDVVEIAKAVAVTAEIMGTDLSEAGSEMMARDLEPYGVDPVMRGLRRCRREHGGRLTLAAIIERIDDGRPGPEEAWGMLPRDESESVVWTDEMRQAFGAAGPLLANDEIIPARMAFLESYKRAVREAREDGRPVHWELSPGHDAAGRDRVLIEAAERGRLPADHAARLCAGDDARDRLHALAGHAAPQLGPGDEDGMALVDELAGKVGNG